MTVRPYAYVAALCKYTYTHTAMHSQHSVAEAWRSYFTQPLLWAAGTKLSFLLQPVEHYSNTNHTTATTTSTDVQRRSSTLAQLLSNWSSDKLSLQGWMEELWCELYTRLYIEVQDAELLQLWLHELSASTYSFPCIAETHSIVPTVSAKQNSTSKLPSTQSQPLQGWYLSGGQAKTVPLHWHYDSNNSSSSSSGSSSSSSNVTALQLARVCSELCDDVVKCVGWSFGPQMAHDSVTAHDVPCSNSSSSSSSRSSGSMCRCVLHATARGDLATDAQHAVVGVQAAAAEHSITYSGVVQRDVAVYTGKQADTTQPNRVLAVVNFHWHIDAAMVEFITQQLYPLCLPVGFDVVVVGPHSGIDGVLLNPWTNKGYYSGLSLALAYQRFPNYDGKLLQYTCY
jgi:STELLO glycosyltransferases